MEIEGFEERKCWGCEGTGECVDMTMADNAMSPSIRLQCSVCKGAGVTRHARFVMTKAHFIPSDEPTGDIPGWMC